MNVRHFFLAWLSAFALLVSIAPAAGAQSIQGQVVASESGEPVPFATLLLKPLSRGTTADASGRFLMGQVPTGEYLLVVQSLGYQPLEQRVTLQGTDLTLTLKLEIADLALDDVTVTATEIGDNITATSKIDAAAIEHVQPTNLGDVLQLLPGAAIANPDLSSANQAQLRQASTGDAAASAVNAFGTAIVLDGAPISNNGNLQSGDPARSGTATGFSSVSGGGADLRNLPADNIESVEVIRGIPSVKYGDLTSGAVIVNTKKGELPYQLKARINPTLLQLAASKGFALGGGNSLNLDLDLTDSYNSPTQPAQGFTRLYGRAGWRTFLGADRQWELFTQVLGSTNLDNEPVDPDDAFNQRTVRSRETLLGLNHTVKLRAERRFSRELSLTVNANTWLRDSYEGRLVSSQDNIFISTAQQPAVQPAEFLPSEYFAETFINSNELNLFVQAANEFDVQQGGTVHNISTGVDWRTAGTRGPGRTFDASRPPFFGGNSVTVRPRPFDDIPFLHHLGVYVQDHAFGSVGGMEWDVIAGLRLDHVAPIGPLQGGLDPALSPRLNASLQLSPSVRLRAGVGRAVKSPSLIYLSPGPIFTDLISFQYFPNEVEQRIVLLTTEVLEPAPERLRLQSNSMVEGGVDVRMGKFSLAVTQYYEETSNGYAFNDRVAYTPFGIYEAEEFFPDRPPRLTAEPVRIDTFLVEYNAPSSLVRIINYGTELTLSTPRLPGLRTSFNLNGAYLNTEVQNDGEFVDIVPVRQSPELPEKVGIYASPQGRKASTLRTTVRSITHIPAWRMVFSTALELTWLDNDQRVSAPSVPTGYYSRDGSRTDLTPEQALLPENETLIRPISDRFFLLEERPFIWNYNVRLTKEFNDNASCSFFANNVFHHRPTFVSPITNLANRRNNTLFFGAEISIKL